MRSPQDTAQNQTDLPPPLEDLIQTIDRQMDRLPNPHAAEGFEDFWGSQIGEYKKPEQQYIRFVVGGNVFAVPLQNAVEIEYLPDVTPLPNLPPWVVGICSLRGDLVSVVDIRQIFGLSSQSTGRVKKLILIRNSTISTAIIVDKIQGMLFADEHILQAATAPDAESAFAAFIKGSIEVSRRSVHLLDVDRLMKALAL